MSTMRISRTLYACIAVPVILLAGLVADVLVLRPYLAARRLVQERLKQGRPIVAAAYDFRRSHGRWPDSLEELVPEFLPQLPAIEGNWSYSRSTENPPVLSGDGGPGRRLMYGFPPRTGSLLPPGMGHGWVIDGREGESFVTAD